MGRQKDSAVRRTTRRDGQMNGEICRRDPNRSSAVLVCGNPIRDCDRSSDQAFFADPISCLSTSVALCTRSYAELVPAMGSNHASGSRLDHHLGLDREVACTRRRDTLGHFLPIIPRLANNAKLGQAPSLYGWGSPRLCCIFMLEQP